MALRHATGWGLLECKRALRETDGDTEEAKEILGVVRLMHDDRINRSPAEGRICSARDGEGSKVAIVGVSTQTSFAANNAQFADMVAKVAADALLQDAGEVEEPDAMQAAIDEVRLAMKEDICLVRGTVVGSGGRVGIYVRFNGKAGAVVELAGDGVTDELLADLCMHVTGVTLPPIAISVEDVPVDVIEREGRIAKAQAIAQGKAEEVAEKMVAGKIRRFYERNVLLEQAFVKDDRRTVQDVLPSGVTIKSFVRMQVGGSVE